MIVVTMDPRGAFLSMPGRVQSLGSASCRARNASAAGVACSWAQATFTAAAEQARTDAIACAQAGSWRVTGNERARCAPLPGGFRLGRVLSGVPDGRGG